MDVYKSIIGGKERGNGEFSVNSPFYDDFGFMISGASDLAVRGAISRATNAKIELSLDERIAILQKAAAKPVYDLHVEDVVKITGIPIRNVSAYAKDIPVMLSQLPLQIKDSLNHNPNRVRETKPGFAYCVLPGNDLRVTAYLSSILVTLGIPAILKASKEDMPTASETVKAIIESGYPGDALNLVCWDTSNPATKANHFAITDAASIMWVFGSDATVDDTLRYERKITYTPKTKMDTKTDGKSLEDYLNPVEMKIDHFGGKTVLRHGSGRAAGILLGDVSEGNKSKLISKSAFDYPIGCNAMKSLVVVGEDYVDTLKVLAEKLKSMKVGDPLDYSTEVGYTSPKVLDYLTDRIKHLTMMGQACLKTDLDRISPKQMAPILVATDDTLSELLVSEAPAYMLTAIPAKTLDEAINIVNTSISGNKIPHKRIAVSVLTNNGVTTADIKNINAHHVRINRKTTDVDLLHHEGHDYVGELTNTKTFGVSDLEETVLADVPHGKKAKT